MSKLVRVCNTGLVVCSGIVFGVLGMTAVVAAVAFPRMKSMDPRIPDYEQYDGPHWSLAAGWIAEGVFDIGFLIAGLAIAGCIIAVGWLVYLRKQAGTPIWRLGLAVVLAALFCTHIGWLQREMDEAAQSYRGAAAAGRNPEAHEAKARFDALHPVASKLIGAATLAGLALFLTSAWAASGRGDGTLACDEGSA